MFQVLLMSDNYGVVSELHGVDMLEIVRVATPCKQTTCGFAWHMRALDCYYFDRDWF